MYYDTFRRGLTFTPAGAYSLGLILFVGLIAITTGINGLYVFLSCGLGGFVVSGILSERSMRSIHIRSIGYAVAEADAPFDFYFTLENTSRWFTILGMENLFFLDTPRYRLITGIRSSVAKHRITSMAPRTSALMTAQSQGVPRGLYLEIKVMNLTTFPLGILEKYKISRLPCRLVISPKVHRDSMERIKIELKKRLHSLNMGLEFYTHLPYQKEKSHLLDWKKNASKQVRDWVVKDMRYDVQQTKILIDAAWREAIAARHLDDYETFLSMTRTVLKAVSDLNLEFILEMGDGVSINRMEDAIVLLAQAPRYEDRLKGLGHDRISQMPSRSLKDQGYASFLRIRVDAHGISIINRDRG